MSGDCDIIICDDVEFEGNPPREVAAKYLTKPRKVVLAAAKEVFGRKAPSAKKIRDIPAYWNNRLTRALGRVVFRRRTGKAHIELSGAYDFTDKQIYQTLVHEYCHVIRFLMGVRPGDEPPHGPNWQALMEASGESVRATSIDPEILRQYAERRTRRVPGVSASMRKRRQQRRRRMRRRRGLDTGDF